MRSVQLGTALVVASAVPGYAVQYLSVEEARDLAFPAARAFEPFAVVLTEEQAAAVSRRIDQRVRPGARLSGFRATRGGQTLGWLVVDAVIGKHLLIDYTVAISPKGDVLGIEILEYRENYGGQVRTPEWRRQFVGKDSGSRLALNEDIRNITGATLSCRHVTEGVKRVLAIHELCLK